MKNHKNWLVSSTECIARTSYGLLTIYAFVNIFVLFGNPILERLSYFSTINHLYTALTLALLIINLLASIVVHAGDVIILRRRLPDFVFIFLSFTIKSSPYIFQLYLVFRQLFTLFSRWSSSNNGNLKHKKLIDNAPSFVLLSFLITILIGTLLLLMPTATKPGLTTTFTGALFTATSATCVTGLSVYEIVNHFTMFGITIIMLLIQVGGLGIMTISTFFAVIMGQRLSLRDENIMQDVIEGGNRVDALKLIRNIILVTFLFEAIGAVLIYFSIRGRYDTLSMAIFSATFHSISAFCNAGIDLFRENFVFYHNHLLTTFTLTFLIVSGGIGFSVMVDIKRNFIQKVNPSRFSVHTKLVLVTTAWLLILGFVLYFIAEFNHSMSGYSLKDRIIGSLFQSVSTRTAGFDYIDLTQLSQASAFISLFLMFIGASPGSTGGGIKTTSFALIILTVIAILSGNRDVVVFKRKISESLIHRVMALIAVSITLLFIVIFLLLLIEKLPYEMVVFEAFSAFGTVGLSMGITPNLTDAGRILIVILMYFGRVGPLTIIYALSKGKATPDYKYLEEKILVG